MDRGFSVRCLKAAISRDVEVLGHPVSIGPNRPERVDVHSAQDINEEVMSLLHVRNSMADVVRAPEPGQSSIVVQFSPSWIPAPSSYRIHSSQ